MSDSRKHQRVPSRIRCWCEGENVTFYARVGNLSEGGLFLRTSTPLDRGTRTRVRLAQDAIEVETVAVVVWSRGDATNEGPPGMGLRFEQLDEPSIRILREIIARETKASGPQNS